MEGLGRIFCNVEVQPSLINSTNASYLFTIFLTVETFLVFTKMFHLNYNWKEPEK